MATKICKNYLHKRKALVFNIIAMDAGITKKVSNLHRPISKVILHLNSKMKMTLVSLNKDSKLSFNPVESPQWSSLSSEMNPCTMSTRTSATIAMLSLKLSMLELVSR